MRSLRCTAVLFILACCGAVSFADGIPPDGATGMKNGSSSTPITSLNQAITFTNCPAITDKSNLTLWNECFVLFNNAQAVFDGINETGQALHSLSISFSGFGALDTIVGCEANSFFSINNCPVTIVGGSATVNYLQGTGTGIGCINPVNPEDPMNATCIV